MFKLNIINKNNLYILEQFLSNAGDTLKTFRYFQKRSLEVIKNHIITYIITDNTMPVCYGHLDKENEKVWLGIAVVQNYQKMGLGNNMMNHLINYGHHNNIKQIFLSVDKDNTNAIHLYNKFGFVKISEAEFHYIYLLTLVDVGEIV